MRQCTLSILLCALPLIEEIRTESTKVKVLILTGVVNHDWRATTARLSEILETAGRFEVRVNEEVAGATAQTFSSYDALVFNWNDWKKARGEWWSEEARRALAESVRSGKGWSQSIPPTAPF